MEEESDFSRFRDWHGVDAFIDLCFMDRIRIALGSRLVIRTEIGLPWRTQLKVSTSAQIDKLFGTRTAMPSDNQDGIA